MYIVVSKWEPFKGREQDFEERGKPVARMLREQPGVKFLEEFWSEDGSAVAIVGYEDRETYRRLIDDPTSDFNKSLSEHRLEEAARWIWSERGESLELD